MVNDCIRLRGVFICWERNRIQLYIHVGQTGVVFERLEAVLFLYFIEYYII